jgi:hypothetical protein
MESSRDRPGFDWVEVLIGTLTVAVVAFLMLQIKEWFDAGRFDMRGTMVDAALVGGGMLILNSIQEFLKKPRKPRAPAGADGS